MKIEYGARYLVQAMSTHRRESDTVHVLPSEDRCKGSGQPGYAPVNAQLHEKKIGIRGVHLSKEPEHCMRAKKLNEK